MRMSKPLALRFLRSASDADQLPESRCEVALVGRSNVGKSSLLNAVANRKGLARTSKAPGATRLLNIFELEGEPGRWLVDRGQTPESELRNVPDEFDAAEIESWTTESDTPGGLLRHLAPVLQLSETPPHWTRPTVPLGHHAPSWPERSA